jgi:two-component system cell cycle sensor histidine kinase/response regulator CckA
MNGEGILLTGDVAIALLEKSADALLIGDIESHALVWANPSGMKMLGRTLEEVKGLPLTSIHPEADLAYSLDQFDRQSNGAQALAKDIPVVSADGSVTYHDVQSVIVEIEGKPRLLGCFRNVDDRREAKADAKDGEDRFLMAIQALPMGLFLYRLEDDGRLVMEGSNPATDAILGINTRKLWGTSIEEAFPPLAETEIPDAYRNVAKNGGVWNNVSVDYEDDSISGAFEVVAFQITPGLTGVLFWDVTEKRKADEEMRRLLAAVESMAESVVITNKEGLILYANPFFENLTGYTLGELKGEHIRVLKSGEQGDTFYKKLWEVLESGESWTGSFVNKKKDGSLYHEDAMISPVKDEDGEVVSYVAVKRDMTHEFDLEKRVMHSQKMAALGQFAHRIAHDVTNRLAIILGSAQILGAKVDTDDGREMEQAIVDAVKSISSLTTDLMAFAHPAAMHSKKQRLDSLVKGMSKLIDRACKPNVKVEYDFGDKLRVNIDSSQIEQAIMHLVVNATEAIPTTGTLKISVREDVMPAQIATEDSVADSAVVPAAVVVLIDSGEGLTEEECVRAFEPFFSTKRDQRRNAGLGLATVYSIVSRHNGDITIRSVKGEGTEVRLALPLVQ